MKNDFKSILAIEFRDYLRLLLSAGRSTHNHEVMLRNLDSFLLQSNISTRCLDENTVNQWLSTICGTSANKVSYIARYRGLSKYLRSVGVAAFEPEYPSCSHTYTPYIFSDEEWKRMISSADDLPYSDNNPESAVLFCILLRILYGCGLRRNEALELETRDIDLNSGVLFVRHAKNDKQRYVPMDESLTELLRWYLSVIPHRKYLFVNKISGKRFSAEWARKRMKHLLQDCDIVFEAVSEDVNIKQRVYSIITEVCGRDIIVVSTTSSIDAAILAEKIENPARFLIAHPFQPVHMLPLVEVVRHTETSEETLNQVCTLLKDLNRQVVMLNRSVPGFLVNRFAQALFRESIYLIEQGITTAADIDRAIKYAVGMRYASIGLLEYYDAVGFELERAIALNVYPDLCDTKSIQKTTLVGIASGRTGQKAGQGLYDWSEKDEDDFRYRKQAPYFEGVRQWHMPE